MTTFYSKQSRLVKHVYAVTASALLETLGQSGGTNICSPPPAGHGGVARSAYTFPSGSWFFASRSAPRVIYFDVPARGRIVDIRVWVEFIHDSRNTMFTGGTLYKANYPGLGFVTVALRSPNSRFRFGHPLWNDVGAPLVQQNSTTDIYRSSYVLWDGVSQNQGVGLTDATSFNAWDNTSAFFLNSSNYQTWPHDIDMRTVFSDGSGVRNPRDVTAAFPHANDTTPENFTFADIDNLTGSSPGGRLRLVENYPTLTFDDDAVKRVNNSGRVSWMYDTRVSNPAITGTTNFTGILGPVPPQGWMTGLRAPSWPPNAENEFLTSGTQVGPADIQPVYPMLDDVQVTEKNPIGAGVFTLESRRMSGFRPGLRGTQVNGRWELLFGMRSGSDGEFDSSFVGKGQLTSSGIWFRQARLEVLVDEGEPPTSFNPGSVFRFSRHGNVPTLDGGSTRRAIQLGTAFFDASVNFVTTAKTPGQGEHGRTVGITDDPRAPGASFAVFSRVTGSLTDRLAAADLANLQRDYLHNEFGTPYVPLSSGSGEEPSNTPFSAADVLRFRQVLSSIINVRLPHSSAIVSRNVLNLAGVFKTTADQALNTISKLSASSS